MALNGLNCAYVPLRNYSLTRVGLKITAKLADGLSDFAAFLRLRRAGPATWSEDTPNQPPQSVQWVWLRLGSMMCLGWMHRGWERAYGYGWSHRRLAS